MQHAREAVPHLATHLDRLVLALVEMLDILDELMFAGVPSSNGAFSVYMAPEWFRTLHDLLPMPAAVEIVRSILYFGGDVVTPHLQVLGIWGLVSLALVFVIDSLKPVRTVPDFAEMPPAADSDTNVEPATSEEADAATEALGTDEVDAESAQESERELEPAR